MDLASPSDMYSQLQAQLVTIKAAAAANTATVGKAGGQPHRASVPTTPASFQGIISQGSSEERILPLPPSTQPWQPQLHLPWVQKYQPIRAADVCGNIDAVRRLKDWLLSWQDRADGGGGESLSCRS